MFAAGLLKVVLATETLALGINMPARSVVIESLRKWDGHEFVMLSAGQYTQLTGRAGRRGIDTLGHGIVIFRPGMEPATVAALEEFVRASGLESGIADPASPEALMDALDADGGVPPVRLHHEIYLGDPRRTKPENLRTVLRHPVQPASA